MEKGKPENQRFQELIKKRDKRISELKKEFIEIPRHKKYYKQEELLNTRLRNELPEELKAIFLKYTGVITFLMVLQAGFYYDNGFRDCAELVVALNENQNRSRDKGDDFS